MTERLIEEKSAPKVLTPELARQIYDVSDKLPDELELDTLWFSVVSLSFRDPLSSEEQEGLVFKRLPKEWIDFTQTLQPKQKEQLSSGLLTLINDVGVSHLGVLRRIPKSELLGALNIGPHRASFFKDAFGHNPDEELTLEDVFFIAALHVPLSEVLRARTLQEVNSLQEA